MRIGFITLLLISFSFNILAQTICGQAAEGGTVTLTAPTGKVFTSIVFASYGTPNGSCGSYTVGACNATNSTTIVGPILIGSNSGTVGANNAVFGDPCVGTVKRLYIEAAYGTLPLTLLSFSGSVSGDNDLIHWQTADEINTMEFVIERSTDGSNFSEAGTVTAHNYPGENSYSFTDHILETANQFYRLKMVDIDGRLTYSGIIRLANSPEKQMTIFPSPASTTITIGGLQNKGIVEISDLQGKILKRINVIGQSQTWNISGFPQGIYIVKYVDGEKASVQKIVKQ
jgi:hypothetical protein